MTRVCPGCPNFVPLVSAPLADAIALRLLEAGARDPRGRAAARLDVLGLCLDWLVEPASGLETRRGIVGRPYTRGEKDTIALELRSVERLPCPFFQGNGCVLGGCQTHDEERAEARRGPWGWLPARLALAIDPLSVKAAVQRGLVADAKLSSVTRRGQFPERSPNGLAIARTLPEKQQEATSGFISGSVSSRAD